MIRFVIQDFLGGAEIAELSRDLTEEEISKCFVPWDAIREDSLAALYVTKSITHEIAVPSESQGTAIRVCPAVLLPEMTQSDFDKYFGTNAGNLILIDKYVKTISWYPAFVRRSIPWLVTREVQETNYGFLRNLFSELCLGDPEDKVYIHTYNLRFLESNYLPKSYDYERGGYRIVRNCNTWDVYPKSSKFSPSMDI